MQRFLLPLLLIFASPANATFVCTFDTECLEGEACNETSFVGTRTQVEGKIVTWDTEAETFSGHMIASDDNLHFVFEAPTAAHLLTEYPDGSARYTVHMDGPFTITYHGTCEDKP